MTRKIMLDAGHGYNTPGNRTPSGSRGIVREWTMNNAVANHITGLLRDYDVEVRRADDPTGRTDVALGERVNRTNRFMPDVFVSIHHNAFQGRWGTHTGTEVFHLPGRNNNDRPLATALAPRLARETGLLNRGAKTANWHVLSCDHRITAILVEGGFMDSTIDYPIITSDEGQRAYARAVANTLIEHLNLRRQTAGNTTTNNNNNANSETFIVTRELQGFLTAADAAANRNPRTTVRPGTFHVFSRAGGMVNVTSSQGVPGSWINPANNTNPETFVVTRNLPGFFTAADAVARRNPRTTVTPGTYHIFNRALGMLNVTSRQGTPGSWINPADNSAGDTFVVTRNLPGFFTAADAAARRNSRTTVTPGTYHVFNRSNGMINVTSQKGTPGSWINPN